jgi:hypothetical protein
MNLDAGRAAWQTKQDAAGAVPSAQQARKNPVYQVGDYVYVNVEAAVASGWMPTAFTLFPEYEGALLGRIQQLRDDRSTGPAATVLLYALGDSLLLAGTRYGTRTVPLKGERWLFPVRLLRVLSDLETLAVADTIAAFEAGTARKNGRDTNADRPPADIDISLYARQERTGDFVRIIPGEMLAGLYPGMLMFYKLGPTCFLRDNRIFSSYVSTFHSVYRPLTALEGLSFYDNIAEVERRLSRQGRRD